MESLSTDTTLEGEYAGIPSVLSNALHKNNGCHDLRTWGGSVINYIQRTLQTKQVEQRSALYDNPDQTLHTFREEK